MTYNVFGGTLSLTQSIMSIDVVLTGIGDGANKKRVVAKCPCFC